MRYLTVREVIVLHARIVSLSGGALGIRDHEGLESAVAQPQMTLMLLNFTQRFTQRLPH